MIKSTLPVLVISDNILFPHCELKLDIINSSDRKCISLAENYFNNYILLVFSKSSDVSNFKIGVVAQIKFKLDLPNGDFKVCFSGLNRANILSLHNDNDMLDAVITNVNEDINPTEDLAYVRRCKDLFFQFLDSKKSLGNSIVNSLDEVDEISVLTDVLADFLNVNYVRKLSYINETSSIKRASMIVDDINYELDLLSFENNLDSLVEARLNDSQKDFLLREKLKVIESELGISDYSEINLLYDKVNSCKCPKDVKNRLIGEIDRFKLCNSNSPEGLVIKNYIDTLLSLPWGISSKESNNLSDIKSSLDESHFGLNDVKDRLVEYITTRNFCKNDKSPIICLVGPPGVGKTSLAKSISNSLKRKCVKISVGGINDEAEITGHRRAYVGARPGKIINGLIKSGVNNPVFIIDEIDKMTKDIKGDPASSLLDVLDREQNDKYVDHYIDEEFDLSKVIFILTANYIDKIPNELKDRLEIIELNSYTSCDKLSIAKEYIIPKIVSEYNIDGVNISDDSLLEIINYYTKESGVRELERILRRLFRKYVYNKVNFDKIIDFNDISILLGNRKYSSINNYSNSLGCVNALAYSPCGGMVVKCESVRYPGNGFINNSSELGNLIKDSISISLAYIKSHCDDFNISFSDVNSFDYFVHLPNTSFKKEGPSAGCCIVTSLLSIIKGKKISNNICITGEISLSGKVISVGGIKEKLLAAISNNVKTVYLPLDNKDDVLSISEDFVKNIKIKYIDNYLDLYKELFK